MRSLLFLIFLLSCGVVFGQASGSAKKDDAKEQAPEADAVEKDSLLMEDPEERSVQSKKVLNKQELKSKQKSVKNAYGYEMDLEEEKSEVQSAEFQNASMSFEYSKKRSSVQRTQRSPSIQQQAEMNDAVGYFEQNLPNSFEFHYFKYTAGNYNVDLYPHLKEAENLRPNNSDVHVQLSAYHIIEGNKQQAITYMNKLVASKRLGSNVLKYSGDILRSTPKNGTLVTHGFDDTYGAWYMQQVKGVRPDVKLISLDFLQSEQYRSSLKSNGYKLPQSEKVDTHYFSEFCRLNTGKKLAVSMTTPKEYFRSILANVYVTGLVFEYRTSSYDNFQRNVDLWEQQLRKELVGGVQDEKAKQLSANYLPMLFQMRKVYNQKGDTQKVKELDKAIDRVAVQCKKYEKVQHLKSKY